MNKRTLIGGIVGGVAFFFLGWLVYGILLLDFYNANGNQSINRPMEEMVWWALIASNLFSGFLVAIVFDWTNTIDVAAGIKKGAILGFLMSASFDLSMFSMTTWFIGKRLLVVDIGISTVFVAIGAGLIAWIMAKNSSS
jgi:hypothetical protein